MNNELVRTRSGWLNMCLLGGAVLFGAGIVSYSHAADDAPAAPTKESGASLSELMLAIRADRCDQVRDILKRGQDPNMRDAFGYTPLTVAALEKRPACIAALLERGADVNLSSAGGWTPLIGGAMAGAGIDVLEPLLKKGAEIDARNQWGCTALYYAAGFGAVGTVDYLIKRGAAVDGTDGECMSAMRLAELKGFPAVIERLKKAGAKTTMSQGKDRQEPAAAAADKQS